MTIRFRALSQEHPFIRRAAVVAGLALVISICASPARADTVTQSFTGTISLTISSGGNTIPAGTPFSGILSYDPVQTGVVSAFWGGTQTIFQYQSLTLTINNQTVTEPAGNLVLYDNVTSSPGGVSNGDSLFTFLPGGSIPASTGSINGISLDYIYLAFSDPSGIAFTGPGLPLTLTLGEFSGASLGIDYGPIGAGNTSQINPLNGLLSSLTGSSAVPFVEAPLVPASSTPGGAGFTLTVNGVGFVSGAVVMWNGSARTTTFVSSKKLTATVNAADVAAAGTASVTVVNPTPGGGTSNAAFFPVTNPTSFITMGRTAFPVPNGAFSVATGDFNGDGKLDLAVATRGGPVSILLGNGDGTFQPRTDYASSGGTSIATGDFNGDGNLDLLTGSSVLLGNGDGTFQAPIATGVGDRSVVTGDFNGDGKLDFAVFGGPGVLVLLGSGDGTFQPPVGYAAGAGIYSQGLTAGDFNGDGKLDLAVANQSSIAPSTVSILLGNGDGTFESQVTYPTGDTPFAIMAGDFNNDGKLDLITANGGPSNVSLLLGNGDGTFQAPVSLVTSGSPIYVASGDFNGDGKLDLVVLSFAPGDAIILLGNGDGTFQPPAPFDTGGNAYFLAIGDFNGDGRLDLATPNPNDIEMTLSVLLQVPSIPNNSVHFGNQNVGTTSPESTLPLTNLGSATLSIHSIVVAGPNAADFAMVSDTCSGAVLAPSASCSAGFEFTPSVHGLETATIDITDNAPGTPQHLPMDGSGTIPAESVAPASLVFSTQLVGTTSSAQPVTLTSTGDGELTVSSIGTTGDFAQSNSCVMNLGPGGTCTVNVTFLPTANGTRTGTLSIADNTTGSPHVVNLSGTGIVPIVSLPTVNLSFSNQPVGTTSAAQTTTLSNTGTAALAIASIVASGDFAETNNCASSVVAGGSCTITVTFTPTATGARTASITITDNNNGVNGSTQTVSLSGTGTGPVVSLSAPLTFGAQLVGTTSNSQTVTLTNTGNGSLTFSAIAATGPFAIATSGTTCSTSNPVAAAATCTVAVTFTPTAAGTASGSLSFSDNAPSTPQTLALSGTGQDFSFAPPSGSSTTATVAPGSPATYTLSVGGEGGLSGTVTFTCTGAPSEAICTVSPNPVTAGSSATNVTVTVATTAPTVSAPRSRPLPAVPPLSPGLRGLLTLAVVLAAMAWVITRRNQPDVRRSRATWVLLALGLLLTLAVAACGGGGGGGGGGSPTHDPGTPAGTSTLTVTGTAGSGTSTVSHSVTLTLTVS